MKLTAPHDKYGQKQDENFVECPILFKLSMKGRWASQTWIDMGDLIRVIGEYKKDNMFHLFLNDDFESPHQTQINKKASMIIVEPQILIPTTTIVNAFPCVRKAVLSNQYKGLSGDINYPLILGNIVHDIFQQILEKMDFKNETIG